MDRLAALACLLAALAACAQPPSIGVEITNAPRPRDCLPGSATRPCP